MTALQRLVLATCLALASAAPIMAQEIGTVAATNAVLDGTPPGAARRTLSIGQRVIVNERLRSSDTGSGHLLFRDHTSLSIAPNSDIVLDRYVYDPERDAGEIAATMAKGVLRFIGGRITDNSEATIATPVATVGIRGGMALVEVCAPASPDCPGGIAVIHLAGQVTRVTAEGQTVQLSRSSARATVAPGGAPVFTGIASSTEIARMISALEGSGEGGANAPSRTAIEARLATMVPAGSGARGAVTGAAISTGGQSMESLGMFDAGLSSGDALGTLSGGMKPGKVKGNMGMGMGVGMGIPVAPGGVGGDGGLGDNGSDGIDGKGRGHGMGNGQGRGNGHRYGNTDDHIVPPR